MRSLSFCALSVCAAAVLLCVALGAQDPATEAPLQIQRRVELVNVDVSVTDPRGNFVRGLRRENFRILDEGVEQPITHFAPIEAPAVALVLVETSPAVFMIHRQHLEAAQLLFDGLAMDDWVGVGTYDQTARQQLRLTQDKRAAQRAILTPRYGLGMGQLNLSDGVTEALKWLREVPAKKALVLLSTGLDTSPPERRQALLEELRASDVAIFAVAMGGDLRDFQGQAKSEGGAVSFAEATRLLETLANTTGGRAWFPRTSQELPAIYRQIAVTLRHRYSLGFAPPARDARLHRIEVRVVTDDGRTSSSAKTSSGLRISTRHGYLAPAP
jgi:VWFA-related protein